MEPAGPRARRLFPDVYVSAAVEVDLAVRSRAAHVLVAGRGVLGGFSTAEVLGASCGPAQAPAEVVMWPEQRQHPLSGLMVRRDRLCVGETTTTDDGLVVTTPLRTAYDLARRAPLVEAVVALDALAHAYSFPPAELLVTGREHLGSRGSAQLGEVVRLADPLAASPMETRIRLALVLGGLPPPVLQHPVGPYLLDLAYPAVRLAIEYDGAEHRTPERALKDLDRQAHLTAVGWRKVLRFPAATVMRSPGTIPATVRRYLAEEARRREVTPAALLSMISAV